MKDKQSNQLFRKLLLKNNLNLSLQLRTNKYNLNHLLKPNLHKKKKSLKYSYKKSKRLQSLSHPPLNSDMYV